MTPEPWVPFCIPSPDKTGVLMDPGAILKLSTAEAPKLRAHNPIIDAAGVPAQTSPRQTAGRSRSCRVAVGARKVRAPRGQGGG